jgi:hypothetical protein
LQREKHSEFLERKFWKRMRRAEEKKNEDEGETMERETG